MDKAVILKSEGPHLDGRKLVVSKIRKNITTNLLLRSIVPWIGRFSMGGIAARRWLVIITDNQLVLSKME